jgi:hypothetical protein
VESGLAVRPAGIVNECSPRGFPLMAFSRDPAQPRPFFAIMPDSARNHFGSSLRLRFMKVRLRYLWFRSMARPTITLDLIAIANQS